MTSYVRSAVSVDEDQAGEVAGTVPMRAPQLVQKRPPVRGAPQCAHTVVPAGWSSMGSI
jgi:hypothetical protein